MKWFPDAPDSAEFLRNGIENRLFCAKTAVAAARDCDVGLRFVIACLLVVGVLVVVSRLERVERVIEQAIDQRVDVGVIEVFQA